MNTHVPNIVRPSDIRTLELKAERVLLQGHERRWVAYGFKNSELPKSFQQNTLLGEVREGCDKLLQIYACQILCY